MRFTLSLCRKNLIGRPARACAMLLLTAFLSFSIFGGSVAILSLRNGLEGLESRLGADVIAMPYEAKTKFDLNTALLQGNPGYFYMNRSYLDQIAGIEGVEKVSAQLYLASASASCCSYAVQIIGFEPDTDFTIQPWIRESYSGTIGEGDIVIGANISMPVSRTLTFFGMDCTVVAQLESTGTALDNAVYGNIDTIKRLITASEERGLNLFSNINPDTVISSVLVKVYDDYDAEAVKDYINVHVRHVVATQSKNMIAGVADGLSGASRIVIALIAAIWALCLCIMMIANTLLMNERRREFAILRVAGASRGRLGGLVMAESALIDLIGSVLGVALGALIVFPFTGAIRHGIGLPYVLPAYGTVAMLVVASLLLTVLAGSLTSAIAAVRISRLDTGVILREG